MKKIEFKKLKKDRTKNYQDLLKYLNNNLPPKYQDFQGNIKEVTQWGNIVKLIFIYLLNENIHTEEMNKKVEELKNEHYQIESQKDNLDDKMRENIEYSEYLIDKELLLGGIQNNTEYISEKRIASLLPKFASNRLIKKDYQKELKKGNNLVHIILKYIDKKNINLEFNKEIEEKNKKAIEEISNIKFGMRYSIDKYYDLVDNEPNKDIQKLLQYHSKVKFR